MAKIYISSTFNDLQDQRRATREAVLKMGHQPVAMESYVAEEHRPLEVCLRDVRASDGYIGIFAWRYGYIPENQEKSITHLEYEEAGKQRIPRLIFMLKDDAPWSPKLMDKDDEKIRMFRQLLEKEHVIKYFSNTDGLMAEVTAAVATCFSKGQTIPPLLTYLCDRKLQEAVLEETISRLPEPPLPLIGIVHGDDEQCHEKFLECLLEVCLPRMLEAKPKKYPLTWPSTLQSLNQLDSWLHSRLAHGVLNKSDAPLEAIHRYLAKLPVPVVIHTHLLTEDFDRYGGDLINRFMEFWQQWPELAPKQRLLVFLFVKYPLKRTSSLLQRWCYRRKNKRLARMIATFDFSRFNRLQGLVLPQLEGIKRADVENWAHEDAADYCGAANVFPAIRQLFEDWEKQHAADNIPMEQLVDRLERLLLNIAY